MWSRKSKSSTDGRRPRGLATVDFAFMKSTLIDELVNFKEGFSPRLIAIRRVANGGADGRGGGAAKGRVPAVDCRERLMGKTRGMGRDPAVQHEGVPDAARPLKHRY
ncbi:hypothetical protein [Burkholderia sp. SCN-KJ]|uniref:hypothetical protein n=1 Tax=Burkholderia sp. SCN-KJ TaxID=2969248 RepID=UPI0021502BD9|nr:hypothetical protein [Burkholderia sp. SCN-KJ]MCR4467075.1 hypothetical protein [Burkholderia sp. SCN-KJ]